MSVESIKGDVLEQLLGQAGCGGNGRTTLESFGFFLETYVIQGAEITLDSRNPRRFTLSEAIISIDDGLYRVSTETLTLKGRGTTYFVDFTVKNGFVVNVQHPSGSFLALWEINTNATGNIVSTVDMRGEMGSIRFKEDMLGIITDQIIVDEQHILNQAVGTTKIKDLAVTTDKYASKSITNDKLADGSITTEKLVSGSITNDKLSNGIVTTDKIADGTVTKEKISPTYNANQLPYQGKVTGANNVGDALDNTKTRIDGIVASAGDSNAEIVDARGGYNILGNRLVANDAKLAEKASQVDLNTTNKNITDMQQQLVPKRYVFGKQLEELKYALSNPLSQYVGITFIGDSITWGMTLPENPPLTPRDGTLSDVRDVFASPSFVNLFKKYIGSKYVFNAVPSLSNWPASPSGESTVKYNTQHKLFSYGGDFTYSSIGAEPPLSVITRSSSQSLVGQQLLITIASERDQKGELKFTFTGEEFTLSFDSVNELSMDYELIVDGVSQGIFKTAPGSPLVGGGTVVSGYDNRNKHTFPYIREKVIKIQTVKTSVYGNQSLIIGGIIVNKDIRITNQGIIGATAKSYLEKCLAGNTSGDGVAIDKYDSFVFCQLGTNDRIISTSYAKGSNTFKANLKAVIDSVSTNSRMILMSSNQVSNESTSTYSFNMQDVKGVIYRLAKENNIDFVDNYSIFGDTNINDYTADGLHPNKLGHGIIARNIINSLEFN